MNSKTELTTIEQDEMLISKTRNGLKMTSLFRSIPLSENKLNMYIHMYFITTALAFTEMGQKLQSVPGVRFLLSEHFNQDSLESYFSNPNVNQVFHNSNTLGS